MHAIAWMGCLTGIQCVVDHILSEVAAEKMCCCCSTLASTRFIVVFIVIVVVFIVIVIVVFVPCPPPPSFSFCRERLPLRDWGRSTPFPIWGCRFSGFTRAWKGNQR
jgi:hypothetical protein